MTDEASSGRGLRRLQYVLVGAGVLIVISIIWVMLATTHPEATAAERYVHHLVDGNYKEAFQDICESQKQTIDEDDFVKQQKASFQQLITAKDEVSNVKAEGLRERSETASDVLVTISYTRSGKERERQFQLRMVHEDGEWRYCGDLAGAE